MSKSTHSAKLLSEAASYLRQQEIEYDYDRLKAVISDLGSFESSNPTGMYSINAVTGEIRKVLTAGASLVYQLNNRETAEALPESLRDDHKSMPTGLARTIHHELYSGSPNMPRVKVLLDRLEFLYRTRKIKQDRVKHDSAFLIGVLIYPDKTTIFQTLCSGTLRTDGHIYSRVSITVPEDLEIKGVSDEKVSPSVD